MTRLLFPAVALLALVLPIRALDWGGSLEDDSAANLGLAKSSSDSVVQTQTLRLWAVQNFGPTANLLAKANVSDALTWNLHPSALSNTVTADLDALVFSSGGLTLGRTTFHDFGSTVLNTTLDGIQYSFGAHGVGYTLAAGSSALVFKSGSTVVISEADLNERTVAEDWSRPSTLFAPRRAMAYLEATLTSLIPGQTIQLAEAFQYDLRTEGVARAGDSHSHFTPGGPTAPVHMSYTGLGLSGRVAGPLYWDLWSYLGLGLSLTPTGPYAQKGTDPSTGAPIPEVLETWRTSYIVNGLGKMDLSLILPGLNDTIVNLGLLVGSWDRDGISPDQNLPTKPQGNSPSLYTGYFGISRTGSALIFNPQPANMAIGQLLYSFKPLGRSRSD
ncbi:MAG TPA: hypothetical protein VFL04_01990, partial [Rectinemataceae bacterium]|nr:hypothetical protein [Rectinemataceae bacterium]